MLYSSVDGIRISIEQFTALNCMCRNATPVKNVQQNLQAFLRHFQSPIVCGKI